MTTRTVADNLLAAVLTVSLADARDRSALAILDATEDEAERIGLLEGIGLTSAMAAAYAGLEASLVRLAFLDREAALDSIASRVRAGGSHLGGGRGRSCA